MFIDFTNVSSGFEKIEPGIYSGRVSKIEQKVSQAGKPYLNWTLEIVGGEYDGRKTFFMTSLSPNALWKLKDVLLNAFGFTKEDLSGNFDFDITDLIGQECAIVMGEEEYQGEMRDRCLDLKDISLADSGPTLI